MIQAATRVIDLTPSMPVWLCGYVAEKRLQPTEEIHDAPQAVAILLQSDEDRFLWIVLDVLGVEKDRIADLKAALSKSLNVPSDQILVSAIHSHSEPDGFMDEGFLGRKLRNDWRDEVVEKVTSNLAGLDLELTPVEAQIASGTISGFYSKRTDPNAPFENSFTLIRLLDGSSCKAAILNFNCHATVVGPQNMAMTADLVGAVRKKAAEELGVLPLTFTGASGDISNRQFRQGNDFAELERVSNGIWNQIESQLEFKPLDLHFKSMQPYSWKGINDLKAKRAQYQSYLEQAQAVLDDPDSTFDQRKMADTEKKLSIQRLGMDQIEFDVEGKILHFQDLTLTTFPGELASVFGLQLKKNSQTPYFLLAGYTDDYQGYFIEQEEYGHTYETKASLVPAGETEKIVEMIGGLQ